MTRSGAIPHPQVDRSDPNDLFEFAGEGLASAEGAALGAGALVCVVSVACIAVQLFPHEAPAPASHATGPRTSANPMSGESVTPSSLDAPMA